MIIEAFLSLMMNAAFAQSTVEFGSRIHQDPTTQPRSLLLKNEPTDDVNAVEDLINSMIPISKPSKSHTAFSTRNCPIALEPWVKFLFGGDMTVKFRFSKGCDINGTVTMTHQPFPVDLELRNMGEHTRVRMTVEVGIVPDLTRQVADMTWQGTEGRLSTRTGDTTTEFNADYRCSIGLTGNIAANPGGTMHFTKSNGKPVNIDRPLRFQ